MAWELREREGRGWNVQSTELTHLETHSHGASKSCRVELDEEGRVREGWFLVGI